MDKDNDIYDMSADLLGGNDSGYDHIPNSEDIRDIASLLDELDDDFDSFTDLNEDTTYHIVLNNYADSVSPQEQIDATGHDVFDSDMHPFDTADVNNQSNFSFDDEFYSELKDVSDHSYIHTDGADLHDDYTPVNTDNVISVDAAEIKPAKTLEISYKADDTHAPHDSPFTSCCGSDHGSDVHAGAGDTHVYDGQDGSDAQDGSEEHDDYVHDHSAGDGHIHIGSGEFNGQGSGTGSDAPFASAQDMADWLTNGYWGNLDVFWHDTDITYSISGFSSYDASGLRLAFDLWEDVSGLDFTEVSSGAEITVVEGNDGRAYSSFTSAPWVSGTTYDVQATTISIDTNIFGWDDLRTVGEYGLQTAIHEIGHSLGLGHGGNYNGSASYSSDAQWSNDTRQYTVMSYFSASNTGADHVDSSFDTKYGSTPLLYDIYAMQHLYGANYSTRAGDTTYGFNSNAGRDQFDFSQTASPVVAIWDGGGTDTIDLSGYTMAQTIRLTSGEFSDIGGLTQNLSIAYGAVIENATGGTGNDSLYGNDAANILRGGAGNDALYGGGGDDILFGDAGNDYIDGGAGTDTAEFSGAIDTYTGAISGLDLILSLGASVVATVTETVEGFIFDGVSYSSADVISFFTNTAPVLTVNDLALNDGQSVLAATIISATDANGDNLVYTIRDTNADAGSAYLQLDGAVLAAATDHSFTQAELDRLEIIGGAATGTDELQVSVSDGIEATGVQNLDVDTTNTAPIRSVMAGPYHIMDYGSSMLLSDLISYTDGAQDSMTYRIRLDEYNSHYLELDGVQLGGLGYHEVTEAEYARLRIVAPNAKDHQDISVTASDGEFTDTEQTVQVRAKDLNTKPDVDISGDINIAVGGSFLASDHIDISDADGDTLTIEIRDNSHIVGDQGYMELDGNVLSENQAHILTLDEFNRLEFFGGTTNGRTIFDIRVDDGYGYTKAQQAKLVSSITNSAAVINIDQSVPLLWNDTILASSVINVTDADGVRDTLTYEFYDATTGGAYLELSSAELASGQTHRLTQAEFDQLNIVADSQYTTDRITMRVSDGHEWTEWLRFGMQSINGVTNVTANSTNINQDDSTLISSLVSATDPEGDTLTYYITDKLAGGSSYLRLDGVRLLDFRAHEFTADEFSRLEIIGGTKSVTNTYYVRTYDGHNYSDVEAFDVTSVPSAPANNAPIWDLSNITTVLGTVTKISDVLSINDADGDTLSYSVFDDNFRGDDAYLRLDGLELAARTYHSLTQAEFDRLEVVTDGVGSERFRIYATDGEDNTGVQSFYTKVFDSNLRIDAGSRSGAVVGDGADNWLRGSNGQEKFFSRGGADDIHGYGGADDFVFEAAYAFSGVDALHDFDAGTGDRLDISDILDGFYDDQTDVLTDFVQITDDGTDSTLSVDQDGGGDNFVAVATIKNATGLTDEDQLVTDGNLIV